jgi:putative flippase GtrA
MFFTKSQNTIVQFLRCSVVAGISFTVDFGILILLTQYAHFEYLFAVTVAFLVGLTVSYFLSISWVFHSSKLSSKRAVIFLFLLIGLIGLGFTDSIMWVLTSELGLLYIFSKFIAMVIVYFFDFGIRKRYLFH